MSTGDPFLDQVAMRRSFFGAAQMPLQRMDFNFGDAGMGGIFNNPLAPMIMQPMINAMFGHGGMMPAQFAPQQSFYDQQRIKNVWAAHNAAMATAAQADRETTVQMIRGIAQMQGTPWGLSQQRSANVMAGDMAFMAPMFAQAKPELFDVMHGTRGSATVMASFLHRGGITAMDPVSGATGMSGDTAGVLAAEMSRRFFGTNADLAGWKGMRAGAAGALYEELQSRGMMGSSIGAMTAAEQTAALTGSAASRQDALRLLQSQAPEKFAKLSGRYGTSDISKLDAIEGVGAGVIADLQSIGATKDSLLRNFDATQIGNRLKNMSGAVAAMREIFGDMGRPNAPMAQLIEGLNSFTQGGLATMNPAQLENTVRTMQVVARTSGVGMQSLVTMAGQNAQIASQMGLDPRFGLRASLAAAEFGAAFGQVGRGDLPAWGRPDREKLAAMEGQLMMNASNSPMASRLGALMRMVETQKTANNSIAGTPLEAIAAAVEAERRGEGTGTFTFGGVTESLNISEARYRQIAGASNIGGGVANAFLRSTSASQETIDRYKLDEIARRAQPAEIRQMMGQQLREAVMGQLSTVSGVGPDQANAIAQVASQAQAQRLFDMPTVTRVNDGARNKALLSATRVAVIKHLMDDRKMTAADAETEYARMFPTSQAALMVAGGMGRIQEQFAKDPRYQGYTSWHAPLDLNNPRVEARRAAIHAENVAEVAMGTALGGVATGGLMQRFMDEVRDPSANISTAVKKILGAVDPAEVLEKLANIDPSAIEKEGGLSAMERVGVLSADMANTLREFERTKVSTAYTPAEKKRRMEALTKRAAAVATGGDAASAGLREALFNADLITEGATDADVLAAAKKVMRTSTDPEFVRNIGGLLAAGGTSSAEAIKRQQVELLKTKGFTDPVEIEKILGGDYSKLKDADTRERIQQLGQMGKGMTGAMEAMGMTAGAKVGVGDVEGLTSQQALLLAATQKELPTEEGRERDLAIAERKRHATNVIERGRQVTSGLLGDEAAMSDLGAGGFKLVQSAHEKQKKIAKLAESVGLNTVEVLMGTAKLVTPRQKEVAAQILGLQDEVTTISNKILRKMNRKDPYVEMTAGEKDEARDYAAGESTSEADKTKEFVGKLLGPGASEEDRKKLEAAIGSGPEADARREDLLRRGEATKELKAMAEHAGLSVEQLQKKVKSGTLGLMIDKRKMTVADADRATELVTAAGAAAEGGTRSEKLMEAIAQGDKEREIARKEASSETAAGGTGATGKMTCSGKVTVDVVNGTMDTTGMKVDVGSTPVAGK